jgi:hypothetical protein
VARDQIVYAMALYKQKFGEPEPDEPEA